MNRRERLQAQAELALDAQEEALLLKDVGNLEWLADDPDCPDVMRLAALTEELGEIARCLHDNDRDNLQLELAQLAGIALAWGVSLDQMSLLP